MIMFYDSFAFFKHPVMVVRNRLFHCNSNNNKTKTKQKNHTANLQLNAFDVKQQQEIIT